MKRLLIVSLLLTTACVDNVSVQSRYNQERDTCRGDAEERFSEAVGDSADNMGGRARNTELATLFSQCMGSRGWTVATPSKPKPTQVADNQPYPGQVMPGPIQASRKMPTPVAAAPMAAPYGAVPPGYTAVPMMTPPPGAIIMTPPPAPHGAVIPMPVTPVRQAAQPVPQLAPAPGHVRRRPVVAAAPIPAKNESQEESSGTPQNMLDRQLDHTGIRQ